MRAGLAKLCVVSVLVACSTPEPKRFGSWEPMAAHPDATAVRAFDAADYADGKLFVWGSSYSRGFVYDVKADSWREATANGRPTARLGASALWANGRVLLWGDDAGAVYDPIADAWSPIATTRAPSSRIQHAAFWTGTRMIVWGGQNSPDPLAGFAGGGGLYDPSADAWTPLALEGSPTPRTRFTAVWTGTKMIVWGGQSPTGEPLGDGAAYDPIANAWTPIATWDAPSARYLHTAVWTGQKMFVWSGLCATDHCINGATYDPVTNTWREISPHDAASKRFGSAGVWTGGEVLLWSGVDSDDGYRWEPIRDAWTKMEIERAPSRRGYAFAFWTGDRMLLWGGANVPASGAFYRP